MNYLYQRGHIFILQLVKRLSRTTVRKKVLLLEVTVCISALIFIGGVRATNSQPVMVKDIFPGNLASQPYLTAVGSTLFFQASDGTNGYELWKSDGSAAGTVMVKDINSGSGSSSPAYLTAVGSTLYFQAADAATGIELWKSDGAAETTLMVKDINLGATSSTPSYLAAVGSTLYFQAADATTGSELWKSDGSASGTVIVKDINLGASSSSPSYLAAIGSAIYFQAGDGLVGSELWKSDGSAEGTVIVKDINLGSGSSSPAYLTTIGSTLYFQAADAATGSELWKSDGSASGTVMVKDINSGSTSSSPAYLTAVGSTLYFQAGDASKGFELWKSDGSSDTTAMIKQVGLGSNKPINNGSAPLANMAAIGLTLYFQDYYELQVPSTTAGQYVNHSGWYLWAYSTASLAVQVSDWKAAGFTAEQSVEMANMSAAGDEFDLLTALIESSMSEEEVVVKKKVTVKAKVAKSPAPVVSETPAPVESQAAPAEPEGKSGINPILIVLVVVLMSGLGLAYFFARRQEMQGNIFR